MQIMFANIFNCSHTWGSYVKLLCLGRDNFSKLGKEVPTQLSALLYSGITSLFKLLNATERGRERGGRGLPLKKGRGVLLQYVKIVYEN